MITYECPIRPQLNNRVSVMQAFEGVVGEIV
jgi:hypothetical protein